jgi:GNAT superfamily N-acetyltransferase
MEIRKVDKETIQTFSEREWAVVDVEEHGFHDPEVWKKRWHFLAAYENGGIVGAAAFVVEAGVGYLDDLMVGAGYRGRGIGSQLLARFEEICQDQGCHKVRLLTDTDSRAEKFYRRNGYWRESVLQRDYLQEDHALMAKFLEGK